MTQLSRRGFLGLAVGATAWACGRGTDVVGPTPASTPEIESFSLVATNPPGTLAVGDRRLAFALFEGDRPFPPAGAEGLRVALIPPDGVAPDPLEPRIEEIRLGIGGDPDHEHEDEAEIHRLLVVEHPLEVPGVWSAQAEFEVAGEAKRLTAALQVVEEQPTPIVGGQAIAVPSPTPDDPLGADPICTRRPMCPMHDRTIEEALGSGRPSVIIFATPAFCASRTCGPVVDIAEVVRRDFAEQVEFVHVEVWKDGNSVGDYPDGAVDAFVSWRLEVEPWIFFVDADGVIRERWAGAWGPDETRRTVEALAAGDL